MSIRTILVPLDGGAMDAVCLAAAGDLARRLKCHVEAAYPDPDPLEMVAGTMFDLGGGAYFSDELIGSLKRQAAARRKAATSHFDAWRASASLAEAKQASGAPGGSATLAIEPELPQAFIRRRALVADLVVTALSGNGENGDSHLLEVALFDAGRPVLGLPRRPAPAPQSGPAVIAWNGSAEAARAVASALPLLAEAGVAVVIHAGEPDPAAAPRDVASFLAWHGIAAEAEELGSGDDPEVLISARIVQLKARMLVMGAYTHSRAREYVFGGVTRDLLRTTQRPLLLAH